MKTEKTQNFSLKVLPEDAAKFRENAALLNMQHRDFFSLLLSDEREQKKSGPVADEEFKILCAKVEKIEHMLSSVFDAIVAEKRVPSFYEFRARIIAETNAAPPASASAKYGAILEMARKYHLKYGMWPNPADSANFGPGLDEQYRQSWPPTP